MTGAIGRLVVRGLSGSFGLFGIENEDADVIAEAMMRASPTQDGLQVHDAVDP